MRESDIAYIAGLFDGEGSIYYARRPEKNKKHKGKGYRPSDKNKMDDAPLGLIAIDSFFSPV